VLQAGTVKELIWEATIAKAMLANAPTTAIRQAASGRTSASRAGPMCNATSSAGIHHPGPSFCPRGVRYRLAPAKSSRANVPRRKTKIARAGTRSHQLRNSGAGRASSACLAVKRTRTAAVTAERRCEMSGVADMFMSIKLGIVAGEGVALRSDLRAHPLGSSTAPIR